MSGPGERRRGPPGGLGGRRVPPAAARGPAGAGSGPARARGRGRGRRCGASFPIAAAILSGGAEGGGGSGPGRAAGGGSCGGEGHGPGGQNSAAPPRLEVGSGARRGARQERGRRVAGAPGRRGKWRRGAGGGQGRGLGRTAGGGIAAAPRPPSRRWRLPLWDGGRAPPAPAPVTHTPPPPPAEGRQRKALCLRPLPQLLRFKGKNNRKKQRARSFTERMCGVLGVNAELYVPCCPRAARRPRGDPGTAAPVAGSDPAGLCLDTRLQIRNRNKARDPSCFLNKILTDCFF